MGIEILLGAGLYFIPTIIAASRNHPKLVEIALGNLVFGWTGLGWIAVLAFALDEPNGDQTAAVVSLPPPKDTAEELCTELEEIQAPFISEKAREAAKQIRFAKESFTTFNEVLNRKFKPSELAYERYLSPAKDVYQSVLDNGSLMLSTLAGLNLDWRMHAIRGGGSTEHEQTLEGGIGRVDHLYERNQSAIGGLVGTTNILSQLNLVDGRVPEAVEEAMQELKKVASRAQLYEQPQIKTEK